MDSFDVDSFDSRMFASEQFLPHDGELIDLLQNSPSPPPSPRSQNLPILPRLQHLPILPQHLPPALPQHLPPALPLAPEMMPTGAARAYSIGLSFQHTIDACLTDLFGGIRTRLTCIELTLSYLRTAVENRPVENRPAEFEQREAERREEMRAAQEAFELKMERRYEEMRAAREAFELKMECELRSLKEARPDSPTCVADLGEDRFSDFQTQLQTFGSELKTHQAQAAQHLAQQQNTDRLLARLGSRTDELERESKKKQRTLN